MMRVGRLPDSMLQQHHDPALMATLATAGTGTATAAAVAVRRSKSSSTGKVKKSKTKKSKSKKAATEDGVPRRTEAAEEERYEEEDSRGARGPYYPQEEETFRQSPHNLV